jgi:hypothetical protein
MSEVILVGYYVFVAVMIAAVLAKLVWGKR